MVHMQHRFTTIKQLLTADVVILYSDQDLSGHTNALKLGLQRVMVFVIYPQQSFPTLEI